MKPFFTVTTETSKIGFQQHVTLDVGKPIEEQLHRRVLKFQPHLGVDAVCDIKKIIEWNSSLRIGFGWSFETMGDLDAILQDCQETIKPPFTSNLVALITDLRCDWIGFVPFDIFDREFFEDLCVEDLIYFNNALIKYQTDVIRFISEHRRYQVHLITRDEHYRFEYFKSNRKDPIALSACFQYYMEAVADAIGVTAPVPRDLVEEMVGCHFLYHPDLFFELLQFYKLKGQIHE
jgi:hypothetical protein